MIASQREKSRLVRAIAREDSDLATALFVEVMGTRKTWTLVEWEAVLADLDSSSLTLADWLASRADWL